MPQEEEVNGKKHELESLKEEENNLLEEIKKTEKELQKFEQNLNIAQELRREVRYPFFVIFCYASFKLEQRSPGFSLLNPPFLKKIQTSILKKYLAGRKSYSF